ENFGVRLLIADDRFWHGFSLCAEGRARRPVRTVRGNLVEAKLADRVDCIPAGESLPAADGNIDKTRLDLDRASVAAPRSGRHDSGARPTKSIEYDIATTRAVLDGIGNESDRLRGRVRRELIHAAGAKRVHPGVVPDIRAGTPVSAQLDIVEMRSLTDA